MADLTLAIARPWWAYAQRLWRQDLWQRIATGAFWSILGAGMVNGLTMVTNVVVARLLGSTHFGELAMVLSTANFFNTVASAGLGMTASRYIAELRDSDPRRAGRMIGLCSAIALVVGAVITLGCLLSAPWLSHDVLKAPGLAPGMAIASAILLFASITASQTGILAGLEEFRPIAFGNLVRGAGLVVLVTAGAAWFGINGALVGYVGTGLATTLYFRYAIRRECRKRPMAITYGLDRQELRILYRFTLPVLVTTFSYTPASWWSNVLLARKGGYSELGVFNAVFQWQMAILFFSSAIANIGLPTLSNVLAEGDGHKYKRCLSINSLVIIAPAMACAIPIAVAGPFIMGLYGPAFRHGAAAIVLISIAAVISAINIPIGHAIWSLEAAIPGMALSILRGGTLVTGSYLLAGRGAVGLAWAYLIMGIAQTVVGLPWMALLIHRQFRGRPSAVVPSAVS